MQLGWENQQKIIAILHHIKIRRSFISFSGGDRLDLLRFEAPLI